MSGLSSDEVAARLTAAHAFHLAGRRCFEAKQDGGAQARLVAPTLVNLCLSAELYLKLIISLSGRPYSKTHSLSQLLTSLPVDLQEVIAKKCRATAGDRKHLHAILDLTSDDFVQWRYAHEAKVVLGSPTELDQVCAALREAVKHLRPGLLSEFEKTQGHK